MLLKFLSKMFYQNSLSYFIIVIYVSRVYGLLWLKQSWAKNMSKAIKASYARGTYTNLSMVEDFFI